MCAFMCLQTGVFMRACVHSHPCTSLDVNSGHLDGSAFRNIASLDVCTMCTAGTAGAVHTRCTASRGPAALKAVGDTDSTVEWGEGHAPFGVEELRVEA